MKFYQDTIGRVIELPDKELVHSFWAWKKSHPRGRETPLERLFLGYMMDRGAGMAWEPVPYRELYIKLCADYMKRRHDEDVALETECEECGRPLDMCECGLCPGGCVMKTPQQGWDEAQKEYWRKHHKVMGCYGCKWAEKSSLGCRGCCTYYGSIGIDENGRCESCRPEGGK